jgi:peptide/nickel transport system permease protein
MSGLGADAPGLDLPGTEDLEPGRPVAVDARARRRRSIALIAGLVLVGAIVLVALVSLAWLPYDPSDTSGMRLEGPSLAHWAGTDRLGRDLATQIMIGARIALMTGLGAVVVGALIGVPVGLVAAFSPGWLDDTLSAGMDGLIAFPLLLLAMLFVAATGASLLTVTVAIGLSVSAIVARLTRVVSRRVLAQQYITAARTSGTGRLGIIWEHVLPNIWPTVSVNLGLLFGVAVLAEASLSYLGLGAPPPNASWGRLLQEAQGTVNTAPIGAIAPGVLLVMLVIGVNLLVDGLRDVADPTQARTR